MHTVKALILLRLILTALVSPLSRSARPGDTVIFELCDCELWSSERQNDMPSCSVGPSMKRATLLVLRPAAPLVAFFCIRRRRSW